MPLLRRQRIIGFLLWTSAAVAQVSFQSPVAYPIPPYAPQKAEVRLIATDVNGDGFEDLIGTDPAENAIFIMRSNVDGSFSPPQLIDVGGRPEYIAALDCNDDGLVDVAVQLYDGAAPPSRLLQLVIVLGDAEGSFSGRITRMYGVDEGGPTIFPMGLLVTQMGTDRTVAEDLLTLWGPINPISEPYIYQWGLNHSGGTSRPLPCVPRMWAVTAADFQNDAMHLFEFDLFTMVHCDDTPWSPGLLAQDFDGNGKVDLTQSDNVSWDYTKFISTTSSLMPSPRNAVEAIAAGDFDLDGVTDLASAVGDAIRDLDVAGFEIRLGQPAHAFSTPVHFDVPGASTLGMRTAFVAGFFGGDNRKDIALVSPDGSAVLVYLNNSTGTSACSYPTGGGINICFPQENGTVVGSFARLRGMVRSSRPPLRYAEAFRGTTPNYYSAVHILGERVNASFALGTGPQTIQVIAHNADGSTSVAAIHFDFRHPVLSGSYNDSAASSLIMWNSTTGEWTVASAGPSSFTTRSQLVLGGSVNGEADVPVPADYDGDGRVDAAVFRPSTGAWSIQSMASGQTWKFYWGGKVDGVPDIPVPGDYDNDGKADIAVWRPSTGYWYIRPSSHPAPSDAVLVGWGGMWNGVADVPVPADYDGDGITDIAIFRPTDNGGWFILPSSTPGTDYVRYWGGVVDGVEDIPVPADYDGDGRADVAVWRLSDGVWYIVPSEDPLHPIVKQFGNYHQYFEDSSRPDDIPVPADYDGDGKTDLAIFNMGWLHNMFEIVYSSSPNAGICGPRGTTDSLCWPRRSALFENTIAVRRPLR